MSLGNISTYIDRPYRTFQDFDGALDDAQFKLVQPGGADNTVALNTVPGNEIGVVFEHLQPLPEETDYSIRLLGKGGTVKVIQSGAIPYGARVTCDPAHPTEVMAIPAAAGSYRSLGRKVSQGGGAAGDVIEIADVIETVTVA